MTRRVQIRAGLRFEWVRNSKTFTVESTNAQTTVCIGEQGERLEVKTRELASWFKSWQCKPIEGRRVSA